MIAATKIYEFDEFRVDTIQRRLSRSGEVVPLTSKAFDLLLALMQSAGRDVSKNELLETVWPGQILEESNLAVNISAIRRALGETAAQSRFIVTIPGHGYRFVANVREAGAPLMGVVIERETFAQVSVEQQIDKAPLIVPEPSAPLSRSKPSWLSSLTNLRGILTALALLLITVAGVGGLTWWRYARATSLNARFSRINYKQLTNNGIVYNAALSPDGKLFAFVMVQKEKESLRVGQTNSTDQIELRPAVEVSYAGLTFSHDGSSLFYSFADRNAERFDLYKIPTLGGVPVKLRDNVGTFFTMSPDDKQIAFVYEDAGKGTLSIRVSHLDGSNETTAVTLPATRRLSRRSLSWSPDGSMISFGANDGAHDYQSLLYATRLTTHETFSLSSTEWRAVDATTWLKDGSGMTVIAQGTTPGDTTQLWYVPYPAGAPTRITKDLATYNVGLGISDDARSFLLVRLQQINHIWVTPAEDLSKGRQITFGTIGSADGLLGMDWTADDRLVYGSSNGVGQSIWTVNPDGTNGRQITAPDDEDQMPSVTGDGQTVVFQSNRSGGNEIWRSGIDGSNAKQLTTCGKNSQPSVSADGQWVVYSSNCGNTGSLWRVPLAGGTPQRVSSEAFSWPTISPDSKWIACALMLSPIKARVAVIPIDGSQPAKFFDTAPLGNLHLGVRWTNDGKAIVYRDQRVGLWRQSIDGGAPARVPGLPAEKIYGFGWSRDNKLFAYTLGTEIRDVVLVNTANATLDSFAAAH
ncbi:MAG TPA: winged helix-turn-helix domain-containing protein [Pyrinomonadaceae bacterium]|nr:winged helix-turn-helix domain-containing protein [Pyrinomonadaceae bacterium]